MSDNGRTIKLALQKDGRLTQPTLDLLKTVGLEFETYRARLFPPAGISTLNRCTYVTMKYRNTL